MKGSIFILACALMCILGVSAKSPIKPMYNTPGGVLDFFYDLLTVIGTPFMDPNEEFTDPQEFRDFTFDHYVFFSWDGVSHTYQPMIYGLSAATKSLRVNTDTNEVWMDYFVPNLTVTGTFDLRVSSVCIIFCGDPIVHEGEGRFEHSFENVTFSFKYELSDDTGRVRALVQESIVNFTSCSIWAENYTIDGVPQTNWEERSLWFKRYSDNHWDERAVLIEEILSYLLNVTWGLRDFFGDFEKLTVNIIIQELIDLGAVIVNEPGPTDFKY